MSAERFESIIRGDSDRRRGIEVKGAGGVACLVFAAVLGCAFWAGAVFASQPWPH